jgi:hypothetical protein
MTQTMTLSWLRPDARIPITDASFNSATLPEREACERALELIDAGTGTPGSSGGPAIYAGGTLHSRRWFADRLALIEARRKAVAAMWLAQANGIYTDEAQTVPDVKMAAHVLDGSRLLSETSYARADQLIAAYEGATV